MKISSKDNNLGKKEKKEKTERFISGLSFRQ